ncbi:5007_t:CDS:1, partial [Gigaspora rosea]
TAIPLKLLIENYPLIFCPSKKYHTDINLHLDPQISGQLREDLKTKLFLHKGNIK